MENKAEESKDKYSENDIKSLMKAFEFFNENTKKLELSYKKLEEKVSDLNLELENKNEELSQNLMEMDSVKNHLNNILESLDIGVVAFDLDCTITIFNKAAEEITGLSRKRVVGTKYGNIYGSTESNDPSPLNIFTSKEEYRNIEKSVPNFRRGLIPIEYSLSRILNKNNEVIGGVEVFSNLTEIKQLRDQVERSKTLTALGEMAANVAHEIRNPLGGIGGYANLLERDLDVDDPRRNLVKKIIEGVASLNRIATNLLIYTRPMMPKLRTDNVKRIIEEVLYLIEVENEQEDRQIEMIRDYPKTDVLARIDPELIQQVFINLIKNANQAMKNSGKLTVSLRNMKDPFMAEVSIKDTGEGMSEEVMSKIFNPFFTTKTDGTGLGLAISKRIVDLHHGKFEMESELDKGSVFKILLLK